ncbi:MAG TPA: hypothetical protein DCQ64_12530 [Candidatus Rokubacteria bacterium]|nr:hypothetical protein [Candidatus Rokubacteria bacterium]
MKLMLFAALFNAVLSPAITQLLKRWALVDELATLVHSAIALTLATAAWYIAGADVATFEQWLAIVGFAGGLLGTAGYNGLKVGSRKLLGQ